MTGSEPAGGSEDGGGTYWCPPHTDNVPLEVKPDGVTAACSAGIMGAGATGACASAGAAHRTVAMTKL